jgi:hypothetical protein
MLLPATRALSLLVFLFVVSPSPLAQSVAQNPGSKSYAPSRLEWLAVEFNSRIRVPLSQETGYSIEFVPLERQDTLLIAVTHLPTANREVMNRAITNARELIEMRVKYYGWSSWLRVREDVKLVELPKR